MRGVRPPCTRPTSYMVRVRRRKSSTMSMPLGFCISLSCKMICPGWSCAIIRCGLFVTFSHVYVDNLDNKNRGNFSQNAFHVIAIRVTKHLSCENKRVQRPHIQLDFTDTSVPQLPEVYALIQPISNSLHVPCISIHDSRLIISYMDP